MINCETPNGNARYVCTIPCLHNPAHWDSLQRLCVSSLFVSGGKAKCPLQTLAQGRTQSQAALGADQVIVLLRTTARAKEPSKHMDSSEQKPFPSRITKTNSQSALQLPTYPLQSCPTIRPLQRLPQGTLSCLLPGQPLALEKSLRSPQSSTPVTSCFVASSGPGVGMSKNIWTPAGIW